MSSFNILASRSRAATWTHHIHTSIVVSSEEYSVVTLHTTPWCNFPCLSALYFVSHTTSLGYLVYLILVKLVGIPGFYVNHSVFLTTETQPISHAYMQPRKLHILTVWKSHLIQYAPQDTVVLKVMS